MAYDNEDVWLDAADDGVNVFDSGSSYDDFLRSIGIDPATTGEGMTSPTNAQILEQIAGGRSPWSLISDLFKGTSSLGKAGQLAALAGVAGLLSKGIGGGGGGGYAGYKGGIPKYTASREMLPIPQTTAAGTPRRPGSGGITYFTPMTYTPVPPPAAAPAPAPATEEVPAARGGIMALAGGGYTLGGYSDGGRLLKGPGDGVSDSIPATIANKQPARLADGEFVIPARIVSELGNGSTNAGARKLYAMMDRIKRARKKSNKDIAADTKADKHLPA